MITRDRKIQIECMDSKACKGLLGPVDENGIVHGYKVLKVCGKYLRTVDEPMARQALIAMENGAILDLEGGLSIEALVAFAGCIEDHMEEVEAAPVRAPVSDRAQQAQALLDILSSGATVDPAEVRRISLEVFQTSAATLLSADTLKDIINEVMDSRPPIKIQIGAVVKDLPEMRHYMLDEMMKSVGLNENTLMIGPAGTGKSVIAEQICEVLGRGWNIVSASEGTMENDIIGRLLPTGEGGTFIFHDGPLVDSYECICGACDAEKGIGECGKPFILDDADRMDPNAACCMLAGLSGKRLPIPSRIGKPYARRARYFQMIACSNTHMRAPDSAYAGANQQDKAFTDRFEGHNYDVGFDTDLEMKLTSPGLALWARSYRQALDGTREGASTRVLCKAQRWLDAGYEWSSFYGRLQSGWTADMKRKVANVGAPESFGEVTR